MKFRKTDLLRVITERSIVFHLPKMQAWSKHTQNANTSGYFPSSVSWSSPSTDIVVFLMTLWNMESKNPLHARATDAAPNDENKIYTGVSTTTDVYDFIVVFENY